MFVFERDDAEVYVAFIRETTSAIEAKINFLKACRIVEHIDGKPITKEALVAVIDQMNARTAAHTSLLAALFGLSLPHSAAWVSHCGNGQNNFVQSGEIVSVQPVLHVSE